jgi:O-antigen/teichoic acid export membrane protein
MLSRELNRLAKHTAIYGLGGLVSRLLAVLLLPLYTHYLSGRDYGRVETLTALTAVLVTLLRLGISSAFFRFYFDSPEPERRVTVVRTSFWFTMASATLGLAAGWIAAAPIAEWLSLGHGQEWLVRAAFVGLWAQMNYEQLTSLFRVEERSVAYVLATLANVAITIAATVVLVVGFHEKSMGVIVGNFIGTLAVYFVLLGYRRYQLGLEFDRRLFREMNRFGMPLVPSALALWVIAFSDRFFIATFKGQTEVGHYSIGVRVASAILLLLVAFRTAWPAFAYSIEDDRQARRAYAFVLTYVLYITCWASLALTLLSPWLVRLLTSRPEYLSGSKVVGPLAFAGAAWAAYTVVAIGVGRARRTQFNWVVTGVAAAVNVAMNLILVPRYGMIGAAVSALTAFTVMFALMTVHAQRVYPVPYQWRRISLAVATAAGIAALGKLLDVPLPAAVLLAAVYPITLLPLGFYLPAELRRLRAAGRRLVAPAR